VQTAAILRNINRQNAGQAGRPLLTLGLILGVTLAHPAQGQELIFNGGFETGTLAGWTAVDAPGSATPGGFVIGTNAPDFNFTPPIASTPIGEFPSVGAKSGDFYAVSDSTGLGAHVLLQNFTVAPNPKQVVLSYDMFLNDWNGAGALNANGVFSPSQTNLAGKVIPTQFAAVDLLAGSAADLTSDVGILNNFYLGEDGFSATALPNGYAHFSYDITGLVQGGGTYRIRFGEVDNQFTLNQGIDNVSILATPAATPEPGSLALFIALTGSGAGFLARRRPPASRRKSGHGTE